MSVLITKSFTTDLDKPLERISIEEPLMQDDDSAHKFVVTVKHGATDETLSGTVNAYFIRADGSTVMWTGTVSNGKAEVTLTQNCYTITGWSQMVITVTTGDIRQTVLWVECSVHTTTTDSIVDPEHVVPSLAELLAKIAACESATSDCIVATGEAEDAAALVSGMTVEGNDSAAPSVTITEVDGHYHLTFGLTGNKHYFGSAITGTSTTPTTYATGITEARVGDMYHYEGNSSTNIGNVYRCTTGGNASTAKWRFHQNIRGASGSGSVSTVNGKSPVDGDVALDAGDINVDDSAGTPVTIASALSGKANSTHTHAISDVTGLQTALDSKAEITTRTGTLSDSGWSLSGSVYTQTISVTGVTSSNTLIVTPDSNSYMAYHTASVRATAQGSGTLTFTAETEPTDSLDVNVLIIG